MNRTAIDENSRSQIITNLDGSMFVDAGAGSGKTRSLTDRVFQLVSTGRLRINQIAVVTFTEKAALELKDRLRSRFETDGSATSQVALSQLDSSAIGTLHSFAKRILGSYPVEAGLPLHLDVMDKMSGEVTAREDHERVLKRLSSTDQGSFLLDAAALAGVRSPVLVGLIDAMRDNFDLVSEDFSPSVLPSLGTLWTYRARVDEVLAECADHDDKLYLVLESLSEALKKVEEASVGEPSEQKVAQVSALLAKASSTALGSGGTKSAWGRPGVEVRKQIKEDVLVPAGLQAIAIGSWWITPLMSLIGSEARSLAKQRAKSGKVYFHDLLVLARDLLRENASVRASLQNEYRAVFLDEFQDTDPLQIEIALRIVGGAKAGAKDWSDIEVPQGSLFIVGDPKQAIYAFRRADVRLYTAVQKWMASFGASSLTLSRNFRSHPDLIEWVNGVCEKMFTKTNTQAPFVPLLPGRPDIDLIGPTAVVIGPDSPPVGRQLMEETRKNEADEIAAAISNALSKGWEVSDSGSDTGKRQVRAGDIAVLFKSRSGMDIVEEALAEAGIPYHSEARTRAYLLEPCQNLLLAMEVILGFENKNATVRLLRTPLFGISDTELFDYHTGHGSITYDGSTDSAVGVALAYIEHARNRWKNLSAPQILARLVDERRVLEIEAVTHRHNVRETYGAIRQLIDDARAFTENQHQTLRDYLTWAKDQETRAAKESESVVPESDLDAVRLTTIHASKGLEYPMVILPGTQDISFHTPTVLWEGGKVEASLSKDLRTPGFAETVAVQKELHLEETQRLLYVAATRAKDHLLVSLYGAKNMGDPSRVADLWYAAGLEPTANFQAASNPKPVADEDLYVDEATYRQVRAASREASKKQWVINPSHLPNNKDTTNMRMNLSGYDFPDRPDKGDHSTAIGDTVHALLAKASTRGALFPQSVEAEATRNGIPQLTELVTQYTRSAEHASIVQEVWRKTTYHTELPIAFQNDDGVLVKGNIDLVGVAGDGTVHLIEYKTDYIGSVKELEAHARHHARQLLAYRNGLAGSLRIGPEKIESYLVFLRPDANPAEVVIL